MRIAVPCEGLAAALEAHGFHPGTIIAANRDDAGNLRRMFPTARIIRLERPSYAPPLRAADFSSKVAVVWRDGPEGRLPEGAEPEFAQIGGKARCYARAREHPLAALSAVIGRARV